MKISDRTPLDTPNTKKQNKTKQKKIGIISFSVKDYCDAGLNDCNYAKVGKICSWLQRCYNLVKVSVS